ARKAMSKTTVGSIFNGAGDLLNNPIYKYFPLGLPGGNASQITCGPIKAISDIANSILAPVGQALDFLLSNSPVVGGAWKDLKGGAADFLTYITTKFVGTLAASVIDSDTAGPELYNVLGAGSTLAAGSVAGSPAGTDDTLEDNVCYNKTPEEKKQDTSLCGKKLTRAQLVVIDSAIAQENYDQFKSSSTWTKLASLDTPYSFASRVVAATPSSPKVLMQNAGATMTAAIDPSSWVRFFESLPNIFTPRLLAVGAVPGSSQIVDENGQDQYGSDIYGFEENDVKHKDFDSDPNLHNLDVGSGCSFIHGAVDKNGKKVELPEECKKFDPPVSACAEVAEQSGGAFVLGDSLLSGAQSGGIVAKLASKGFAATIDAVNGRSLTSPGNPGPSGTGPSSGDASDAVETAQNRAAIAGSSAVIIELGTNSSGTSVQFESQARALITKIGAINPDATVYWVNILSDVPQRTTYNGVLKELANDHLITLIDVDGETFAPGGDGIHLSLSGYVKYADFIAEKVTKAPANEGGCTTTVSDTEVTGDGPTLAKEIIASGKVTGDARYMKQIIAVSKGDFSCNVNPDILKLLAGMVKKGYTIHISSLNRFCTNVLTASGTGSLHYTQKGGHAVDVDMVNGSASTGGTALDIKYIKDAAEFLPSGSELGQVNCRQTRLLLPGVEQVNDSCNHIHMGVPPKQVTAGNVTNI
ncbi:MAG TPA: GDSL-type esterase/lipase family protein, partial [Candidatus Polarisedimenticolaceae bacterium]|nr:GDSL-type esterase/lipase family protein [Candidatus Polarisedimenticolaceae bacterium]